MSNLKQRTSDCSSHIQEIKNRAILSAEYNGGAGPNATERTSNNANSSLLNMNGIRYHRHQRSWSNTLSVTKARNLQKPNIIK